MASFIKVNNFLLALGQGAMNFTSDTVKVALFRSTSNISSSSTGYAALTQEATGGNGYTTGGKAVTTPSWALSGATVEYSSVEPTTWTASGGATDIIFQYIVYYDDTASGKPVIGYYDYGATVTLSTANGDSFTVTPQSAKLFTIT